MQFWINEPDQICGLATKGCLCSNDSHCGNTFSKASLILRLRFGHASIVPDWEKWAKKRGNYLVVTYTNPQEFDLLLKSPL